MRFPAKITSSCIWVAIPVDWVILHWYTCGADGRSLARSVYGHVITKFSWMGSLPHFLTHGAPLRALRARAPLLSPTLCDFIMFQYFRGRDLSYSLSWFLCFFFIQNLSLQVDHVTFKERFVCRSLWTGSLFGKKIANHRLRLSVNYAVDHP